MLVARRKSIVKIAKDSSEAVALPLVGVNNVIAFDLDYQKEGHRSLEGKKLMPLMEDFSKYVNLYGMASFCQ